MGPDQKKVQLDDEGLRAPCGRLRARTTVIGSPKAKGGWSFGCVLASPLFA